MTMEYITSNKGGRKLAFENNIYIKQKVLSNGTVWGDIMGGFCPGGFCPGGFYPGDFVRVGFVGGDFVLEPFFGVTGLATSGKSKPISLANEYH